MIRVGFGEDTHAFAEGRKLILGGVELEYKLGLMGHSDADVLTHSIIDALLGAAALGDIGRLFPDNDEQYRGISSLRLLEKTASVVREAGYAIVNTDSTIVAQEPKLASFINEMRAKIAQAMSVDTAYVSIKATTPERLGPEGRLEGITSRSVVLIEK